MSRLELASERLNAALEALLAAAEPLLRVRNSAGETASRVVALSEERDRLLARVAELERESRALSGLTQQVETRLDGAIEEIRTALGR